MSVVTEFTNKRKREDHKKFGRFLRKTSLLGHATPGGSGFDEALGVIGEAAIETTIAFLPGASVGVVGLRKGGLPIPSHKGVVPPAVEEVAGVFVEKVIKCIIKKFDPTGLF